MVVRILRHFLKAVVVFAVAADIVRGHKAGIDDIALFVQDADVAEVLILILDHVDHLKLGIRADAPVKAAGIIRDAAVALVGRVPQAHAHAVAMDMTVLKTAFIHTVGGAVTVPAVGVGVDMRDQMHGVHFAAHLLGCGRFISGSGGGQQKQRNEKNGDSVFHGGFPPAQYETISSAGVL